MNLLYGPWLFEGMTRLGSTMERLRERGSGFVTPEAGTEFFLRELARGGNCTVACRGSERFGLFRPREAGRGTSAAGWSLLEEVRRVTPDLAEASRMFHPRHDRFIAEHVVARESILPGVAALEMMAQTAAVLAEPGQEVTEVRDLALVRAVRFPRGEPRLVRTRARRTTEEEDGAWYAVELFTDFERPGGEGVEELVHARCRIRFGKRLPPKRASLVVAESGLGDCRIDVAPLWNTRCLCDRRGGFRNVRSVVSLLPRSISAEVLAPVWRELGEPALTGNPLRLDGSVFFVDFLTAVYHGNSSHYVDRVDSIIFYADDHPGAGRLCRSRITQAGETTVTLDIEALDSLGRVRERLEGVHKVASLKGDAKQLEEPIWEDLRCNPQMREMARLLGHPGPIWLTQVRVPVVEQALVEDQEGLLKEWLTPGEMEEFQGLARPKRRREWLSGRIAAKGAVEGLLGLNSPPAAAIRISAGPERAPVVLLPAGEASNPVPFISIAHSGGAAVAAAAFAQSVGIDVEEIVGSIRDIARDFAGPGEAEMLEGAGLAPLAALTGLWCAKEAARKVLGPTTVTMRQLKLVTVQPEGVFIVCELEAPGAALLRALVLQSGRYAYAVARAAQ